MRIKLLVILFIGLCSNFAGAIKAEQKEICTYSQPSDFGSCNKKNNLKIIPKYPVSTFDWNGAMWIDSLDFFLENWENAGTIFNIIELSAPNNDQIEIKIGQKKQSFWIMTYIAKKFISSKIIISMSVECII